MPSLEEVSSDVLPKGAVIGRYLVLGLVGRGGMGEVYAAYDPELDRKVAVKLLRGQSSDAEGRVRLLREAQAIAKLSHPNVIVVFDVGTFRDSVFIAMEFVEGGTVGFWLQAGTRSWREVLAVFSAAGRGLAAAHAADMVHRDFKPDNVMVTTDGQVRVMDFGLARRFGGDAEPAPTISGASRLGHLIELGDEPAAAQVDLDATARLGARAAPPAGALPSGRYLEQKLTQTGAMIGTPAYMAPEQFAGTETDSRTDQFSFCVALYEALYGHRPFEGDTVVAVMANVVSGTIRSEPAGSSVPARFRRVLLRGLEADPEKRWSSMPELLGELQADSALASPRVARPARRDDAGGGGAPRGAALLARAGRPLRGRGCAPRGRLGARGRHAAEGRDPRGVSRRRQGQRRAALHGRERAARRLRRTLGLDVPRHLRGDARARRAIHRGPRPAHGLPGTTSRRREGAHRPLHVGRREGPRERRERRGRLARSRGVRRRRDAPQRRATARGWAGARARRGDPRRHRQGARARRRGTVHAGGRVGRGGPRGRQGDRLRAARGRGVLRQGPGGKLLRRRRRGDRVARERGVRGRGLASRRGRRRVRELRRRALRRPPAGHALGASLAEVRGRAILGRLPGHPVLEAHTILAWGTVEQAEGNSADGAREQQRTLALIEQSLGPLHPDAALASMNLGNALHELGRDAEAEPYGRRAVETFERLVGTEGAPVALAVYDWGEQLAGLGRVAEARGADERALAIWTKANAAPFFIGIVRLDLARLELAEKRPSEARRLIEGSIDTISKQDAQLGAEARLVLAEALWPERRARARAATLAREARSALVAANAPARKLAEVDGWLRAHATP